MKKILFLFIICFFFFLSLCSYDNLLSEENVLNFQNIADLLLQDSYTMLIYRDMNNIDHFVAKNAKREEVILKDVYKSFINKNESIGCISKILIDLNDFDTEWTASYTEKKSLAVINREYGGTLLKRKAVTSESILAVICIQEYGYNVLLGYYLKGNAYVYAPKLELNTLGSEELSVFGFAYAKKTKFDNWFYIGLLG